ncbi:MAG: hypothetical protein ACREJA_05280 [Candidatus Methylomirabilales bacterium]
MKQQMNRRSKILLGVTIFAAVILVFDQMSGRKAPRSAGKALDAPAVASVPAAPTAPSALTAPPVPAAPATVPTAAAPRLASPPPPDQPWGKRDPFEIEAKRLPRGPKGADQFSGYKLTGIVWGSHGYQALINDRVVRVGDQVDGARIVRITKTGVEVEKNGEARFLPLVEKEFFR